MHLRPLPPKRVAVDGGGGAAGGAAAAAAAADGGGGVVVGVGDCGGDCGAPAQGGGGAAVADVPVKREELATSKLHLLNQPPGVYCDN